MFLQLFICYDESVHIFSLGGILCKVPVDNAVSGWKGLRLCLQPTVLTLKRTLTYFI